MLYMSEAIQNFDPSATISLYHCVAEECVGSDDVTLLWQLSGGATATLSNVRLEVSASRAFEVMLSTGSLHSSLNGSSARPLIAGRFYRLSVQAGAFGDFAEPPQTSAELNLRFSTCALLFDNP